MRRDAARSAHPVRVPRLVGWGLALHGGGAGREEGSPAPVTTRAALSSGHRHAGRGLPGGGGGSAGGRGRRAGGPCRAGPGARLCGRLGAAILCWWRGAVPWGLWAERPTSALLSAEGWGTPVAGGGEAPSRSWGREIGTGEKKLCGRAQPSARPLPSYHSPRSSADLCPDLRERAHLRHRQTKSSPESKQQYQGLRELLPGAAVVRGGGRGTGMEAGWSFGLGRCGTEVQNHCGLQLNRAWEFALP